MNSYFKEQSVRHLGAGRFLVAFAVAVVFLTGCHHPEPPIHLLGEAQGTYYSILYRDPQGRWLQPQVDSLLAAFDQSASLWVDNSLLRRINANQTDTLDHLRATLLQHSLDISRYTNGTFDVRVGRLVQSWGFSFKERSEPDSTTLMELRNAAHAAVCIDTVDGIILLRKESPATELDFNAIAQGYSADLIGRMFDSLGIHDYLVDIGGEVVAHGTKSGQAPWRIGIEQPAKDSISTPMVQTAVALHDAAVVTSGNYRKYYERDGIRYSHTIDPSTGRPVRHTLLSVSVVEREAWLADAMATAYMVMGLDSACAFIATHPGAPGTDAVYFIYDDNGVLATYATPAFEKLIPL